MEEYHEHRVRFYTREGAGSVDKARATFVPVIGFFDRVCQKITIYMMWWFAAEDRRG